MRKDDCIFCKLANGVFPTNTIYEDETFRVIMDISPATKGHALVIPKNHYNDIYDIDPDVLAKAAQLSQKVIKHTTKILGCPGYNIVQNNGEVSGQTVFHFHMHLIPRYEGENNKSILSWTPGEMGSEELKELTDAIRLD